MIQSIINDLYRCGYKSIVITSDGKFDEPSDLTLFQIRDPRSAAFFSLGLYKQGSEKVALIVNEDFISSTYTALTECWFQRVPLLVISYNASVNTNLFYLERCAVINSTLLSHMELEREINTNNMFYTPVVYRIIGSEPYISSDFSDVITCVNNLNYKGNIIIHNSDQDVKDGNVQYFSNKYRFGALSKYIANCLVNDALICIPSSYLESESNVFNCRYISKNFKCVVLEDEKEIRFKEWVLNNNIHLIETNKENLLANCSKLLSSNCATLLYIK